MTTDKESTIEGIAAALRQRLAGLVGMTEAQRETALLLIERYLAEKAQQGLLTLPLNDVAILPGADPSEMILRWRLCPPADYVEVGCEEVEVPACQWQDRLGHSGEETP